MDTSARIEELKGRAFSEVRAAGQRTRCSIDAFKDVERLRIEAWRAHADEPVVLKRALAFEHIARRRAIGVEPGALLAGDQQNYVLEWWRCEDPEAKEIAQERNRLGIHFSDGHQIADYGRVLREGFDGISERIRARLAKASEERSRRNLRAMLMCAEAAADVGERCAEAVAGRASGRSDPRGPAGLRKHGGLRHQEAADELAEVCRRVPRGPARTFREAVQSFWLTHAMLHWEDLCTAVSAGRVDQFLYPFLAADLSSGRISETEAQELVDALWLKFIEGDESQNVTLGGCDADGRECSNELTLMCLRASTRLKTWQPSVSLRVSAETPAAVWDAAADLVRARISMPAFFNDAVVIAGLEHCGLPTRAARDYGIVGCYEATGSGNHYGRTVAAWVNGPAALKAYLAGAPAEDSFEAFLDGCLAALGEADARGMAAANEHDAWLARATPSVYRSILVDDCIGRGRMIEEGGARFNSSGLSFGGLTTLADSLLAIRELVFERGEMTMPELVAMLAADYEGAAGRLEFVRNRLPKYGRDDADADALAVRIADRFVADTARHETTRGGRFFPGLYQYKSQIMGVQAAGATPDGRCSGEHFPYGVGPNRFGDEHAATAIMNSAARLPHAHCPNGNALEITLMPSDLGGGGGRGRVRELVTGYFKQGGQHLCINVLDPRDLREAREHPERFPDLMVRVSGLSARFVALDAEVQGDLIQRTER